MLYEDFHLFSYYTVIKGNKSQEHKKGGRAALCQETSPTSSTQTRIPNTAALPV